MRKFLGILIALATLYSFVIMMHGVITENLPVHQCVAVGIFHCMFFGIAYGVWPEKKVAIRRL